MRLKSRWIFGLSLTLALSLAAIVLPNGLSLLRASSAPATANALVPARATNMVEPGPAATQCPPYGFVNTTNLAKNPSFEVAGPNGPSTSWQSGGPNTPPSAANNWLMHSSNQSASVQSNLAPTNVPGPGGSRMLHFVAGGNEGGIYQLLQPSPAKVMFSAWVFVRRGHVAVQADGGNQGPTSWSTKKGEWEQLRVCTDGTLPTGMFIVFNEDPNGGDFFVDRAEIRETP